MTILSGIKIIEIEGIGPAPFCGMHLADLGADVVVIERQGLPTLGNMGDKTITKRGKRFIKLNLKDESDRDQLLKLVEQADGLIEGMRPGVMERLGIGPDICHAINPKLAYGRVTGWGQSGPLSEAAGHDINYIGLSGALWYSGQPGNPPFAPPTLLGDIAGGALYLTIGILAAILNARQTGKGDVVDAAMIDGTSHMMNLLLSLKAQGGLSYERGQSMIDGPHWFDSYECSDGKFITIGSLEPKFYALLLTTLNLTDDPLFKDQFNAKKWPLQKSRLTEIFKSESQQHWCELMEGTDVCFAPVLHPGEAALHPHIKNRQIYKTHQGNIEASAAPRFTNFAANSERANAVETSVSELLTDWIA
ncbi:MAG: CoA transferase [Hellea sp.]|nr:CoA transferase [Hellea sp.]